MSGIKHSPLPWTSTLGTTWKGDKGWSVSAPQSDYPDRPDIKAGVAFCQGSTAEANAAHIVHCVNLHDELVEALEILLLSYETTKEGATLRVAAEQKSRDLIAKAKGGA